MPSDNESFSFWRQWLILKRRQKLILLGTLLCGLTAGVLSIVQPKIYRSTTYLLVSDSHLTDSNAPNAGHIYYELLRSYEMFLNNDSLIEKIVQHFQLGKAPYELTPDRFKRSRLLQVELSKNSRLLEVAVEFPDARLAAEIANYFASSAVAFNEDMNAQEAQKARDVFLKDDLAQTSKDLEESGRMLLEFGKSSDLEELRESVLNLQEEKVQSESRLADLKLELSRSLASRKGLTEELKRHQAKLEPSLGSGENRRGKEDIPASSSDKTLPGVGLSEAPKTSHEQIQSRLAEADVETHSLRAGIDYLEQAIQTDKRQLSLLFRKKTLKETEFEQLTQQNEQNRENYATLSKKHQEAAVSVSAHSTNLKLIAPAIPPETPVKPRIALNVLIALALGLLLSSLLALVLHQLEVAKAEVRTESERSADEKIKEIRQRAKGSF